MLGIELRAPVLKPHDIPMCHCDPIEQTGYCENLKNCLTLFWTVYLNWTDRPDFEWLCKIEMLFFYRLTSCPQKCQILDKPMFTLPVKLIQEFWWILRTGIQNVFLQFLTQLIRWLWVAFVKYTKFWRITWPAIASSQYSVIWFSIYSFLWSYIDRVPYFH